MLSNYQIQLQKKIADCLEYEWPEGTLFRVHHWKNGDSNFNTIAEAYDYAEINGVSPAGTEIKRPESKRFTSVVHIKL